VIQLRAVHQLQLAVDDFEPVVRNRVVHRIPEIRIRRRERPDNGTGGVFGHGRIVQGNLARRFVHVIQVDRDHFFIALASRVCDFHGQVICVARLEIEIRCDAPEIHINASDLGMGENVIEHSKLANAALKVESGIR